MNQTPLFHLAPLEHVAEGMTVVDADGRPLGTVRRVVMGDPEAITTTGNEPATDAPRETVLAPRPAADGGALMPALGLASDTIGADVPPSLRTELRRAGFIELDAPDRAGWARYIAGDRVAEVVGQIVRLGPVPTDTRDVRPPAHEAGLVSPRGVARVMADPSPTGPSGARSTRGLAWLLGAVAALACGGLVGLWLYRRRREEARLHRRVRRAAGALADQLPERGGATAGALGIVLLLVALIVRVVQAARPRRGGGAAQPA